MVRRAWGWYFTFLRTPWLCIKLLRFKPRHALSMQRHEKRTEVWFFLNAVGKIEYRPYIHAAPPQRAQNAWLNKAFEVWVVKKGWWHRFTAFEKPVYVIELQYGKVSEEDIERE